ncbi:MAG TPA: hypothetical protein VF233_06620 [Nitrososphaeraceae archaeon]|jgi:hypothetical protein|nr:hypothetical protein [Thermoproteota archaeon]MDQ3970116.1 hypothetical protein [Thermoproteota archaeon]MDQ4022266.1 hypothetical protein [Thermoproteota archaeon]HKG71438.1 hypothetical protein [Nitrososphaeraceae archaeon]
MEKSSINNQSESSTSTSTTSSSKLKTAYETFLQEAATLFPKVDQKLLLNILQFQTSYQDWEGSVMLKIIYPATISDIDAKKDWIYRKYQRVSTIEENRTLRFKAIRMYIEEMEKLLKEDPTIEYITGSATMTPSDAYAT